MEKKLFLWLLGSGANEVEFKHSLWLEPTKDDLLKLQGND